MQRHAKVLVSLFLFCRTLFTEFSHKCTKDERFQAIEKSRERETLFEEYRNELKKQSRKSEQTRRESIPTPKTISEVCMLIIRILQKVFSNILHAVKDGLFCYAV